MTCFTSASSFLSIDTRNISLSINASSAFLFISTKSASLSIAVDDTFLFIDADVFLFVSTNSLFSIGIEDSLFVSTGGFLSIAIGGFLSNDAFLFVGFLPSSLTGTLSHTLCSAFTCLLLLFPIIDSLFSLPVVTL